MHWQKRVDTEELTYWFSISISRDWHYSLEPSPGKPEAICLWSCEGDDRAKQVATFDLSMGWEVIRICANTIISERLSSEARHLNTRANDVCDAEFPDHLSGEDE